MIDRNSIYVFMCLAGEGKKHKPVYWLGGTSFTLKAFLAYTHTHTRTHTQV